MSETITIYIGSDKVGKARRLALSREAKRQGKKVSVADVIWRALRGHSSEELRADLEKADKIEE